ncbi:MAG: PD-(D/E)XK nuclease-like domain-containing protein [Ligilactobacillus animalis]|uniref:PD-(D/E)XK nuclease-like domain-containing protein n=1 Tax=Ligilactobacillus animalis TaxID=1605 RepID=UPI00242CB1E6|nr:PD-(D/E)XK nuclease-like domain-containing protein [Ligilactobacillus animalis]MCI5942939.1 PD-(D/E)XK nuclease-like domain-containing protein [Ligilactobacillus animalis]MDY2993773.1 PD-(D/E)XK nuclease-like domain-containing protein [Ligilactobacillus animalis]
MSKFELTQENYYSPEASQHYMSVSLFKDFMKCEAYALAKIKGEWKEEETTALLVGNYVHSYFESKEAHQKFLDTKGKKMVTKQGNLRSDYRRADVMIKELEQQSRFTGLYGPGQKEAIVTGNIYGYPWKGKIDSLSLENLYFCDLKTVDDIHKKHWQEDSRQYENFIADRGYFMQMAVYSELIEQTFNVECQPFMFAVSKQDPPDKLAIKFTSDRSLMRMQDAMRMIEENQEHIQGVIRGEEEPIRCNRCAYCRATKIIDLPVDACDIEIF